MKTLRRSLCILLLFCLLLVTVSADNPYYSYNNTEWVAGVASPDVYDPVTKVKLNNMEGVAGIRKPSDFYFDGSGLLYVLDTSGQILVLNADLELQKTITVKTQAGEDSPMNEPNGIFVGNGSIYVADGKNGRALKLDMNGVIQREYTKPDSAAYTSEIYQPSKILADQSGVVYVLSDGVYQGVIMFSDEGEFLSFYGSAQVTASLRVVVDRIWKMLMPREMRNNMSQYVPVSFTNFDMDSKGFIYTSSYYTNESKEQIRKLNYLSQNVYPFTENFGEAQWVWYKGNSLGTNFVDVEIMSNEVLLGLDLTRSRVYAFDQEGNRLFNFRSPGGMVGAFSAVAAVESYGNNIYVLDSGNSSITMFQPTEYGGLILDAVSLYREGEYQKAMEPWQKVLDLNANYEMAYTGMGEAYLKLGEYKEAVDNFRLAFNRERESKAFEQYRSEILRQNIPLVVIGLLLLLVLLLVLTNKKFLAFAKVKFGREEKPIRRRSYLAFAYQKRLLTHPLETLDEMKFARYKSYGYVGIILVLFFAIEVLARQYTGFRFNQSNPNDLNIFIQLCTTVVMYLLFVISNWSLCSIMGGEGRIGEISTGVAYALSPYLIFKFLYIFLSQVMTLDEQAFLTVFLAVGILWSVFLLFQVIRTVHQYSSGKTILVILLTIVGIAVILFMMILIMALFQQIYAFFESIYVEIAYRR